jgi:ectoine hydroxylase-related dioxygenase (phytanoyl-CoA dioxygenase family)
MTGTEREVAEIRDHGYAVLSERAPPEIVADLREALDRLHAREAHLPRQAAEGGCLRGYNLVRRDAAFRAALQYPPVIFIAEAILGDDCILHSFESRSALPGGGQQSLHRDMPFVPSTPLSVNVVWMLDDFTETNGATRLVAGSHRRPEGPQPGQIYAQEVLAIAPAGTILAFDTMTWHGGGTNRTDRIRRGIHVHYCRSWVRPQRDHVRSMDGESLTGATPLLVRLLGYRSQMEFEPALNDFRKLPVPPEAGGDPADDGSWPW